MKLNKMKFIFRSSVGLLFILGLFSSLSLNAAQTVQKGSKIKVHYTGTLDDGTKFDSSEGREPLAFTAGSGQMIPGFDKAVIGMKLNESKTIKLPPAEAYGEHDKSLIRQVPKNTFPKDFKLEKGRAVSMRGQNGQVYTATITGFDNSNVTLDFNPALAGKTLTFKIKVISIQ